MFASLPGVSAPPPFGGNQRTVVITVDPERLRAYDMTPDDVVSALAQGNAISPSGNLPLDGKYPFVPVNSVVRDVHDLETIPLRAGPKAPVYIRDVGYVQDSTDVPTGYALVNGRRAVYILVTKRADASTLSVVNAVKAALPDMQAVLPPDIHVSYEFDQSPYVTRAIWGVVGEGALGAVLVGLMILLFLRDWRSAIDRLVEHPAGADGGGGRALAHRADDQPDDPGRTGPGHRHPGGRSDGGDREHPHARWRTTPSIAGPCGWGTPRRPSRGSWRWSASWRCSFPRFSCRVRRGRCSCPCRWPSASRWWPRTCLSSTLVPVLSVWLLRHVHLDDAHASRLPAPARGDCRLPIGWLRAFSSTVSGEGYERLLARIVRFRWGFWRRIWLCRVAIIGLLGSRLGTEIFPTIDTGQFRLRMRAPDGTDIDRTEQVALKAWRLSRRLRERTTCK